MRSSFAFVFIVFAYAVSTFGQSSSADAPIHWERYHVSGTDISIEFPKLPIRIDNRNPCDQMKSSEYVAYAGGVAFSVKVVSKEFSESLFCEKRREFGTGLLKGQIAEYKKSYDTNEKVNIGEFKDVLVFSRRYWRTYIFDDLNRNRWIEVTITHRDQDDQVESRFVASLQLRDKNTNDTEIGNGSPVTLGDRIPESDTQTQLPAPEQAKSSEGKDDPSGDVGRPSPTGEGSGSGKDLRDLVTKKTPEQEMSPLVIAAKARPSYTDVARQKQEQGTVLLRVTFLKNGSIGAVTPVKSLDFGLTEQAIVAARKIVFLPAKRGNVNITVVKLVEYSFRVY